MLSKRTCQICPPPRGTFLHRSIGRSERHPAHSSCRHPGLLAPFSQTEQWAEQHALTPAPPPLCTKPVRTRTPPHPPGGRLLFRILLPLQRSPRFTGAAGGCGRGQSLPGFGSWGQKGTDHRAAVGLPRLSREQTSSFVSASIKTPALSTKKKVFSL